MRGSRLKFTSLKRALNELIWQNKRKQMKEQVLNMRSKTKKLANMLYQAHKNCSKQASFWKLVIIQLKIKILSEVVMMTNFVTKSSKFIRLLIWKKSRASFLFKRNEKKNHKGTLTPKMTFAARFSCCATINFNSILKYFPRGCHNKFYIKIFGIYPTIDL